MNEKDELVEQFMEEIGDIYKRLFESTSPTSISGFLPHILDNFAIKDEDKIHDQLIGDVTEIIREERWDDEYWISLDDYQFEEKVGERLFDHYHEVTEAIEGETNTELVVTQGKYIFLPVGVNEHIDNGEVNGLELLEGYLQRHDNFQDILKVVELVRSGTNDKEMIENHFPIIDFDDGERTIELSMKDEIDSLSDEADLVEMRINTILSLADTAHEYFNEDMNDKHSVAIAIS